MKYKYSKYTIARITERKIKSEWIEEILREPDEMVKVSENEIRYFKTIKEFGDKILKVVSIPYRHAKNQINNF